MYDFSRYQLARYEDGGRGNGVYDCWGWVRERGNLKYGWPLLNSYGNVAPANKNELTKAANIVRALFERIDQPEDGCIAEGVIGKRSMHLGLVENIDKQLLISHASEQSGICMQSIEQFAKVAGQKIRYWRYVG